MSKIFDPSEKHKLESKFRKKILPVEPLLEFVKTIPAEKRRIAIDVGSGTGYFAIPLSRYFQKVYGIEISVEMAFHLANRMKEEKISNIGIIISDKPDLDFNADFILFSSVLHEMDRPNECIRLLRSNLIVVIDWRASSEFGPKEKISEKEMVKMMKSAGFRVERINTYKYHYFLVGRK